MPVGSWMKSIATHRPGAPTAAARIATIVAADGVGAADSHLVAGSGGSLLTRAVGSLSRGTKIAIGASAALGALTLVNPGHVIPVEAGVQLLQSVFGDAVQSVARGFSPPKPLANPDAPLDRAKVTMEAVDRQMTSPLANGVYSEFDGKPYWLATTWPVGQAIAAHMDIARSTGDYSKVDSMVGSLDGYKWQGAYAQSRMQTPLMSRLWDDNAWLGLDFLQGYNQTKDRRYLDKAEALIPFFKEGVGPTGGMYWMERNERMTYNAPSNFPTEEMLLRLYQADPKPEYLEMAKRIDAFAEKSLRRPDGLVNDNVDEAGNVEPALYTYNQGSAIGADLMMHRVLGAQAKQSGAPVDTKYLERAKRTANAAVEYFGQEDRLWKSPPGFNAIFFRNLLELDQIAPDPRYRKMLDTYLDRAWTQARTKDGMFVGGGIGKYTKTDTKHAELLDQSALAQMFTMQAWPKEWLADGVG